MRRSALPILPAIQTYGGVGEALVGDQLREVRRRGLPGYQAYTIAHASDAEWAAIVEDSAEVDMEAVEELRRTNTVASLLLQAAGYALRGERLPASLRAQLLYLLT
jgi:hypothetical protein